MDSLSSQADKLGGDGLFNIDSTPLESIILDVVRALKQHDVLFCKLPELEAISFGLRKDLNKLKVSLESATEKCYHTVTLDETKAANVPEADPKLLTNEASGSYGLRKCDLDPIHQKHAEERGKINCLAISNGLGDVKAKIRKLQQDHDNALVNSLELEENTKKLKYDLLSIQQKLAASVSMSQLQEFQQSVAFKHSQIEADRSEFERRFREDLRQSIEDYLVDIKASYTSLDTFLKQRQDIMESRVASCAKEYDVAAFCDEVESDIARLKTKASFLDDTTKAQGKTMVMLQQKNALVMFHRRYSEWRRNILKTSMIRWKLAVQREIKYETDKVSQRRLLKKTLTNIMSRRKRVGFGKWMKYLRWHRRTERLKIKASALVGERLNAHLISSKTEAFYKWRRMTVAYKMTYIPIDIDVTITGDKSKKQLLSTASFNDSAKNQYDLMAILDSLKSDAYGVSCALAQELKNIKKHDIAKLRTELVSGQEHLLSSVSARVDDAMQNIDLQTEEFRRSVTLRVNNCDGELSSINSQLKELGNLFKSNKILLKNIEESNSKRLNTLCDQNDGLQKRVSFIEELAKKNSIQVGSLATGQSKSDASIQQLSELIPSNECRRDNQARVLSEVMDHFGDELLRTKVTIGHMQVKCQNLERELSNTKRELLHFQQISKAENEKVVGAINYPGIQQTSIDRIVRVGHAYENLAKEKNYVLGINVKTIMSPIAEHPMTSGGEKLLKEEHIDVPAEIAAFAHDYAEWIAYQADHESLLRLIAGTNPDEQAYAEDDMNARRKSLLKELQSALSSELERVSYPGVVDSKDATTRGLGLRWEARAIFLARILDATKAALSKHDHLSLPAQTRLGRTRPASANITVCVACDRPMRNRGSHDQPLNFAKQDGESLKKHQSIDSCVK